MTYCFCNHSNSIVKGLAIFMPHALVGSGMVSYHILTCYPNFPWKHPMPVKTSHSLCVESVILVLTFISSSLFSPAIKFYLCLLLPLTVTLFFKVLFTHNLFCMDCSLICLFFQFGSIVLQLTLNMCVHVQMKIWTDRCGLACLIIHMTFNVQISGLTKESLVIYGTHTLNQYLLSPYQKVWNLAFIAVLALLLWLERSCMIFAYLCAE